MAGGLLVNTLCLDTSFVTGEGLSSLLLNFLHIKWELVEGFMPQQALVLTSIFT